MKYEDYFDKNGDVDESLLRWEDFYFARQLQLAEDDIYREMAEAQVVITSKLLWDEEKAWCDQSLFCCLLYDDEGGNQLGGLIDETMESVFEWDPDKHTWEQVKKALLAKGLTENPEIMTDSPWG